MELVQPVAIRSAEFCVICRFSMREFAVLGSQEGCAYERIGLMYCLYTCVGLGWYRSCFTFSLLCMFEFLLMLAMHSFGKACNTLIGQNNFV